MSRPHTLDWKRTARAVGLVYNALLERRRPDAGREAPQAF